MSSSVDVSDFIYNGGTVRYKTYDMMIPVYVPTGYKATGCTLYFENQPDDIYVRRVYIDDNANGTIGSSTSPGPTTSITFSQPLIGGSLEFIVIEIMNDTDNITEFNGGYVSISPL